MNSQKIVAGVVGNKSLKGLARDSDGDKHIDPIDCEPNNKNKQGFFHDIKDYAKRKAIEKYEAVKAAPGKYLKEREEKEVQEKYLKEKAREKAQEVYYTERKKAVEKREINKAKIMARGGSSFIQSASKSFSQAGFTTKVNPTKTRQYLFGNTNITRNEMGSMLGTNSNKKKGTNVLNMRI